MTLQTPFFRSSNSKRWLRAVAILLATLLLHLLAAHWGRNHLGRPATPEAPEITVSLLAPPLPAELPLPLPLEVPKPRPIPRPKPQITQPAPAPQAEAKPESSPAPPASAPEPTIASAGGATSGDGTGNGAGNGTATAGQSAAAAESNAPDRHTDAPPSVALKYNVQGLRDGQRVYGSGKISWRNQGDRYRIDGSASVLFFTLLQFSSDGALDQFGVSPTLYTEQRFHKPATDTRFEHARNTITFSSSANQYARPGDAQDRASIIWQLATIGRGDPTAFFSGAHFIFFVAGVHDAEPWQVNVVGQENIDGGGAALAAWHLVRQPQAGSYDQKIDIWLAPQQQWYPVRIRYTESDGDFLEMSLSGQAPLAPN